MPAVDLPASDTSEPRISGGDDAVTRFDRASLAFVVGLAAVLRIPGLDVRGRFDADQGHDMLTLVAFVRDGVIPLLGPKTSVGDFHHGAFYYYLLAPSAALSNGDPVAVTLELALLGIAAVALTWWLARAIGGPWAGLLAGALLAVSPAAIEESTFIWNPNPIAFFAALALAAVWRARTGGRTAWWALATASAGVVFQLHVLGVVFLIAIVALALLELRRDRSVVRGLLGGIALVALLFVPLLVHELTHDFAETRGVVAYIAGGDPGPEGGPIAALVITLLRVVGWPLVGLVIAYPTAAILLLAAVVGLVGARWISARGEERMALRMLVGIAAWSTLALAFVAPSLQRVVLALPNDHYHAFLDPVIVVLVAVTSTGLIASALASWRASRRPAPGLAGTLVGAVVVVLVAAAVLRQPPWVDPDGGWAAARAAGARIVQVAGSRLIRVVGLPDFKLADGIIFPVIHAGGRVVDPATDPGILVVACDRLFETAIGAPCGGSAEDREVGLGQGSGEAGGLRLLDRFDASPRTAISVYGPANGP